MVKQYEDGRKQKAAWHKQQNDPLPLFVWETLSGDNTGTYIVGRLGQHWSDFDKPAVPDQADLEEYQKVVGNYVDSIVGRYYDFMPKISNPDSSATPPKFDEIITFHVRYGKGSDFRGAISRVYDAAKRPSGPSITNGMRWPTAATPEPMYSSCRAPIGRTSRTSLT